MMSQTPFFDKPLFASTGTGGPKNNDDNGSLIIFLVLVFLLSTTQSGLLDAIGSP